MPTSPLTPGRGLADRRLYKQWVARLILAVFLPGGLLAATPSTARAGEGFGWLFGGKFGCVDCLPRCCLAGCPDNYCRKPLPCVGEPLCTTCDDYRCKPLPCVGAPLCATCDDYRCKPLPCPLPCSDPACNAWRFNARLAGAAGRRDPALIAPATPRPAPEREP
ncbi:hypothetical protein [Lignipirellula cremea]|uniref:Uncharacterized protein n=1 Tax=Lignipirellula cremea TaxID=2528010 RepID=A0A518DY12_9BACT|nr:hypothetical protein [Lignipirellula cremea]QDU96685.1 hypothetical protein Pla8534_45060 [Lignipirellula cremea]